ncbi:MAG: hypothetical protein R3B93_23985 [Bacteroidia bacterium]
MFRNYFITTYRNLKRNWSYTLINREYLVIFSIAGLLGVGAGYFSAEALLSSIFEYHNGVSLTAFLMAVGALLSVCVVTVGSKVYRAANANPTDVLRSE